MEILTNKYKYLLIFIIPLLLSACKNIYWGSIKNTTNEVIEVKLTFVNKHGTQVLELQPIKSNENSLWEYKQSSFIINKIDDDLSMVEATNNKGCTVTFNRAAIDQKVENHELEVVIETQDFIDACGE
jgi:hypothetical protein